MTKQTIIKHFILLAYYKNDYDQNNYRLTFLPVDIL